MPGQAMEAPKRPANSGAAGIIPSGWLLFLIDFSAVLGAVVGSLAFRFETTDPTIALNPYLPAALIPVVIRPPIMWAFGLHRREWKHASLRELTDLIRAVATGSFVTIPVFAVLAAAGLPGTSPFPRSFFALEPILFLGLAAGARFFLRTTLERAGRADEPQGRPESTLVYGAGNAGAIVGRMIQSGSLGAMRLVGYLDDDARKRGSRLLGVPVRGSLSDLARVVTRTGATQLIVAIPSGQAEPVRRAVAAGSGSGITVKTVPPLRDLVSGGYEVTGIRTVSVEDLLRRRAVSIDVSAIAASINGASVLVTGAGGSIGGELVRQILTLGPRILTAVDHHEWALWKLEQDVSTRQRGAGGPEVVAALADVRSGPAMRAVIERAKPDVVFHAAALKHVPYVELFPAEGVLTNVVGTRNLLRAAERFGVPRVVLISTDKAVEPVSVMGATKRLAEQLTVATGQRTGRAYVAVRFGNVLGSSGSVVPLLQRQIDAGLPLTITHPEATRFFMTISEAVSLILQAGADPSPGEVYVLDMGEPIRIMDLARDLVRLNGLDPDAVGFTVMGLRPGERLHEKLFYDDEVSERTSHPGILRASRPGRPLVEFGLEELVRNLSDAAMNHDDQLVRDLLMRSAILGNDTAEVEAATVRTLKAVDGGLSRRGDVAAS